jgi:hypothetical protein
MDDVAALSRQLDLAELRTVNADANRDVLGVAEEVFETQTDIKHPPRAVDFALELNATSFSATEMATVWTLGLKPKSGFVLGEDIAHCDVVGSDLRAVCDGSRQPLVLMQMLAREVARVLKLRFVVYVKAFAVLQQRLEITPTLVLIFPGDGIACVRLVELLDELLHKHAQVQRCRFPVLVVRRVLVGSDHFKQTANARPFPLDRRP